ncbi:hypothetical protein [Methylomonas methanica]|uniref:KAP NTPase domain-containing protein n=1 Tax=Methylomonas methanica TaxID=421 RepID=A0A177MKR7_METMH|nr:hypothetical protein [Methylomonas methanica]OAI06221.1 hypothetical protein A1332_01580 [Methylomonas methanica]
MNEELIIDLSLGDNALRQDNKHLFHRRVYERLSQVIKTQLARTKDYLKKGEKDNINHSRSHDAILLDGERGTGKTWVLVNLQGFIEREPEFKSITEDVLFLDPVDPTLLSNHEDFLNIVVGQINKSPSVKRRLETSKTDRCDVYYRHLEDLATALESQQSSKDKDRVGLDRLLSYQGSLDIAQNAHEYFREVLEFTGKRLIVLSIDDVDMSLCHGFKVLEVVRKYLCSPYVLPIVSGDLRLYQELVENKFCEQLVHGQSSTSKERQIKKTEELTNEYLRKVFPAQQRITVPTIENYCQKSTGESTKVQNGDQSLGNLYGIHQLLLTALNGRVNGEENSAVSYAPRTARELIQLLNALKPVLEKLLNNDFPPLKYEKTGTAYLKDDITRWWLNLQKPTKESPHVYALYTILSSYFQYSQQLNLRELSEALKKLNHATDSTALNELTYLNPARQLKLDDAVIHQRLNENYDNYIKDASPFIKQADRLPPGLRNETARLLTALPAIEPIDAKLKFTQRYVDDCVNKHKKEDYWLFLFYLFSHSDYYTSYQTAPLVFFGRFFELITTSLIRDIDDTWLRELLTKPPYYSIMSTSATKTFDIEEEEEEQIENEIEISEKHLLLNSEDLKKIAYDINQFRHEIKREDNGVEPVFADISLLNALQSKYFNQANLYKKAGYVSQNKKRIRPSLRDDNLLKEIAIRAAYTYWGALGSFEKSKLFFKDDLDSVVHQNFFDVSGDARSSKIRNNQTYSHNISPFIKKKNAASPSSFTSYLGKHPVYKFIRNLTVDDCIENDEAECVTNRDENAVKITNYEAIRSLLPRPFLTKQTYEKLLKAQDDKAIESVKKLLIDFYNTFEKHLSKTNQDVIESIANAKLGAIIKSGDFFNYSKPLDRLLHLVREKLLKTDDATLNDTALNDSEIFSKLLIDAGVDEKIVKLLEEGI